MNANTVNDYSAQNKNSNTLMHVIESITEEVSTRR